MHYIPRETDRRRQMWIVRRARSPTERNNVSLGNPFALAITRARPGYNRARRGCTFLSIHHYVILQRMAVKYLLATIKNPPSRRRGPSSYTLLPHALCFFLPSASNVRPSSCGRSREKCSTRFRDFASENAADKPND